MTHFVNIEHDIIMKAQQQVPIDAQEFLEWAGKHIHEATPQDLLEYLQAGLELNGMENPQIVAL